MAVVEPSSTPSSTMTSACSSLAWNLAPDIASTAPSTHDSPDVDDHDVDHDHENDASSTHPVIVTVVDFPSPLFATIVAFRSLSLALRRTILASPRRFDSTSSAHTSKYSPSALAIAEERMALGPFSIASAFQTS